MKKHNIIEPMNRRLDEILIEQRIMFSTEQHEKYIRLLCEHSKLDVLPYLKSHSNGYRIEIIQKYCMKYKVLDAQAYLCEQSGDPKGALNLILKSLEDRIRGLWEVYEKHAQSLRNTKSLRIASAMELNDFIKDVSAANTIYEQLNMAIGLCARYSQKEIQVSTFFYFYFYFFFNFFFSFFFFVFC